MSILFGILTLGMMVSGLSVTPASTEAVVSTADFYRAPLYRDGSISCSGADDTSRRGGNVILFPQPGVVHYKVNLRNAQPNTQYNVAVSEEPNCANAEFEGSVTTNGSGDGVFYGSYSVSSGNHNLLVNLVAPGGTTNARNREIGTMNAYVAVP